MAKVGRRPRAQRQRGAQNMNLFSNRTQNTKKTKDRQNRKLRSLGCNNLARCGFVACSGMWAFLTFIQPLRNFRTPAAEALRDITGNQQTTHQCSCIRSPPPWILRCRCEKPEEKKVPFSRLINRPAQRQRFPSRLPSGSSAPCAHFSTTSSF